MSAYYNEFDPFAAAWLRELIKDGLIADGIVDERSIAEVEPNEIREFSQCHFFAGIGGWSYALRLAGWPDTRRVWTGSPPCQPFSQAGKRRGTEDERHLWPQFFRLISECKPPVIFGEQVSSAIRDGWFDSLQADLEGEGYACGMVVLPAASVGAPHKRDRLWFVADAMGNTDNNGCKAGRETAEAARHWSPNDTAGWVDTQLIYCRDNKCRPIPTEPTLFPLANGVSNRVGTLRGAGNAIVPQVAAEVIKAYMERES